MLRTTLFTVLAISAFAANSVLARLALATSELDALSFTGIRLTSGALMLAALLFATRHAKSQGSFKLAGSWPGAVALLGYALPFSLAYMVMGAGPGALILFPSVQFGILGWAVFKGDRPGALEWIGIALALGGVIYLVSPGLVAPSPVGASLMVAAGLSWAAYTLLGRNSRLPLADTAGNFIRCAPAGLALIIAGAIAHPVSMPGVAYAVASGAVASGLGYAIWYSVLPSLSRTRAAVLQLCVPAIAAIGGVLFLAEPVTDRLLLSSLGVIGGIALAVFAAHWRKSA